MWVRLWIVDIRQSGRIRLIGPIYGQPMISFESRIRYSNITYEGIRAIDPANAGK